MKAKFTLIELLVVVAIVAVLLSVLLPSLNLARDAAKRINCAGNLRQQALCFGMYENDFGGLLPAPGGPTSGVSYGSNYTYAGKLFTAGYLRTTNVQYWGAHSANCGILKCLANKQAQFHYGMNIVLPRLLGVPANASYASWQETFVPRARISKISTRMLLGDAQNFIIGGWDDATTSTSGGVWYPHELAFNILYLDSHVAPMKRIVAQNPWNWYPLAGWND